jgi:hypothetical protein
MSTETLLLLIVIALVIVTLPAWSYSKSWGYRPTGVLTILLVIFIVWAIAEKRPLFRSSVGQDIRSASQDIGDSVKRAVR